MKAKLILALSTCLLVPVAAEAQQSVNERPPTLGSQARANDQQGNLPVEAQRAEDAVERAVRRFRLGVQGGIGLDPELIMVAAHATFGPVFRRGVDFRPGVEVGLGELTTLLAINLDVIYKFGAAGSGPTAEWVPYIGAGPSMGLSHRGFETDGDDSDNVDVENDDGLEGQNRFDFSDTDFNGGMNFIAGARRQNGLFLELKATAWGVSNIRLMAGFDF
jgi:hypothetical protein